MHNRLNLLRLEEHKALKRIEETRTQAEKIMKIRAEQAEFEKQLEAARQRDFAEKLSKVQ